MQNRNAYYRKLQEQGRERFAGRVQRFMEKKSFSGRQGLVVTDEMKVLISAAAVQVTFGLDTWDLSYFNEILIYPTEYQNPKTGNYHKGETNLGGFMCFSWKHFLEGNASDSDKINLGLHEFAHALRFNGVRGNDSDYFFENYFPRWIACASVEFSRLRSNQVSIFRKYGGVNINEFFSVVVETFFEAPQVFAEHFPELYLQTSVLLNQTFSAQGTVELDCRDRLLDTMSARLSKTYFNAFRFNLRDNSFMIFSMLFFTVGSLSLQGEGYKYPPAYICLGIAAMCWMNVERKYTRIAFSETGFILQKGFLMLKGYRSVALPLSHLISLVGSFENVKDHHGGTIKQLSIVTVTYYNNGNFYEEDLSCDFNQPEFDQLSAELKRNSVHLFITG
ncbi:MAG: zinc-dependent peptidase [Bacteroidia bacterium]